MSLQSLASADDLLAEQAQVLEQIVRGAPLNDVLAALCRIVESHAGSEVRAAILLVDSDGTRLHTGAAPSLPTSYSAAIDGAPICADLGTCCRAAAVNEVVITPDIANDLRWASLKHLPLELGLVAAWSMPIVSSTNTVLGTFGTYFLTLRAPLPRERRLVEVLARTAALAIERHRADCLLRENASRLQFLSELHSTTQTLSAPPDIMQATARMLADHLGVDRCAYAEIEDERVFVITGDHSVGVPSIVGRWDVSAFGAACVDAMRAGQPFVVHDTDRDPRIGPDELPAYRATTIRAVICVPLHKSGRFTAAMAVHQREPRVWTTNEIELVSVVVARCWEALERARVTRNLLDSEARYRTMVQANPECVKVVAADGTLLQINHAGLHMIECDEARAIGRNIYDVIAPEYREQFREFNERVCSGTNGELAFDIIGDRGTRRAMETTAVALPTVTGDYVQLAISRDVTARVEAERAVARDRARLEYAVRLSGIGFWYCNLPFDELVWDDTVKSHFFLPPDARVTMETFYERIHPDDRAATRVAIDASISEHRSYDVIYRTVDPSSGSIKFVRALGGTTYDRDGTPRHFDGVTVDVTAQKRDEERLARIADAALAIHSASSLERVLQVITEQARELVGAHLCVASLTASDHRSQIETFSMSDIHARARNHAPISGADLRGELVRSSRPVRMTPSEVQAHPAWRDVPATREGHAAPSGWLAVPFIASDGANLGLIQLSDKYDGDFTAGDEAVLVQLAQLAAVAIENARLYDRLREQDRRKDEFLATLAHELRNPLAPIRTGLHLLQQAPERGAKVLPMMERQLVHLVRMVDDLLDISRVTLGKITLATQRVDLRAVIDSALETARPLVEAGGHELALRLPSDALPLDVDPTRLSQVFSNLINNAAKYTPNGGRITISADRHGATLEVRVSDTGTGIPEDMLPRVFDMFTQVGGSIERSQGGLGIGLTLVRRLVEMHGGTVEAQSPGLGLGSTFVVRLPLARAIAAECSGPTQTREHGDHGLRVLVVDDNVDAADMLAMLLEIRGNHTRLAHDGAAALAAAVDFGPDIVFLDIGLPEMNGYEVATRLRADSRLRQPLLVALTGWGSEEDRRQAHLAGFDRHLVKPIDRAKLDEVLTSVRAS